RSSFDMPSSAAARSGRRCPLLQWPGRSSLDPPWGAPLVSGGRDRAERRATFARCQYALFVLGEPWAVQRDARIIASEASDDRFQFLLDMFLAVAVEQMPEQAAIEIGRAHEPVGDREGEV